MYDYLTERGVDARRLILEENATNTAENFDFSRELLRQAGIDPVMDTVAVVTNDFHIARARLLAARATALLWAFRRSCPGFTWRSTTICGRPLPW